MTHTRRVFLRRENGLHCASHTHAGDYIMGQVLWGIVVLCLAGAPGDEPGKILAGSWWINGNGTAGEMMLRVTPAGKVEGTIYGQPLAGTFDIATKRLTFKRKLDTKDNEGKQEWTG